MKAIKEPKITQWVIGKFKRFPPSKRSALALTHHSAFSDKAVFQDHVRSFLEHHYAYELPHSSSSTQILPESQWSPRHSMRLASMPVRFRHIQASASALPCFQKMPTTVLSCTRPAYPGPVQMLCFWEAFLWSPHEVFLLWNLATLLCNTILYINYAFCSTVFIYPNQLLISWELKLCLFPPSILTDNWNAKYSRNSVDWLAS